MADQIPITFKHSGKDYAGHFSPVSGHAGVSSWHLLLNGNFYYGTLRLTETRGWVFDSPKDYFQDLIEFFAQVVTGSKK